ncbi:IscS subfamily cysteine desulfurase, partial [Pseudomonas iridis]
PRRPADQAHSTIRVTGGRVTTEEEIDYAAQKVCEAVTKLRTLSPLWDMYKDGVDISKIEWAAH